jgi:CRISPR-associated protein Csb3
MSTPEPTIRVRLDPLNPGQFFACCGLLELADRAWTGGAEGWFEEPADFFCIAPFARTEGEDHGASALLARLGASTLSSALMSDAERARLNELSDKKVNITPATEDERARLEELWDRAKDGPLALGEPFNLRIAWHLDDAAGGSRFKTWAGQQTLVPIAKNLKAAADQAQVDATGGDWLLTRAVCANSLHVDVPAAGSDIDVGFSFDPLKIASANRRVFVELLALIGLARFRPRRFGRENLHGYATWTVPLTPEVAAAAACGAMKDMVCRAFEFRLLFRTKYLKSFMPAQPRGESQ